MKLSGPGYAVIAAVLFGISPPLAKLTLGEMSPALLAGLLYIGSGIGLSFILFRNRNRPWQELGRLKAGHRWKLLGAVASGGVLAPLFLAYGIQKGTAFEVSLLLNLESVTTTVLAWLVFREHVGKPVWFGKLLLLAGGLVISYDVQSRWALSVAGLLVFLACLCWGIDNNLTRDVDDLSPVTLAWIKGWTAGVINVTLGLVLGAGGWTWGSVGGALGIGAFSYGVSLVLFILALRSLGSARTSTYFATGPFFGMFFSLILLGDRPHVYQWVAAVVMGIGLWVLSHESHEHSHTHERMTHRHQHVHDEHHQHRHNGSEGGEPHDHLHTHEPITHRHAHWPDIHHRHRHGI